MKTLRIKRAAAILMIAMMTTIAAEQASASMVPRPMPHPTRFPESGDFLGQWLGIDRGSLWETVVRLVI